VGYMSKGARELSEQKADQLEKIFELATGSPGFRKLLSVDPSSAIDRTSNPILKSHRRSSVTYLDQNTSSSEMPSISISESSVRRFLRRKLTCSPFQTDFVNGTVIIIFKHLELNLITTIFLVFIISY